ncbi:hypothetical protein HYH03_009847 [Edaphochlamys debaryana]|uniref:Uncharacterized protein n=1 Tax=Edaphochlamys debaryana TaxID=47281 RepID=A0A835XXV0_9CHLO|nr:hypothetical protein HYH03_009847 [Edaphochlamys debaryana]|eukprot:KAG2491895.1 hypothetical protein HYH03_009847 [Edaphochlamys debaryana]
MGIISFAVSQAAISSLVLGALKNRGAITVKPESIRNEYIRSVFVAMVGFGETCYIKSVELADSLKQAPKKI